MVKIVRVHLKAARRNHSRAYGVALLVGVMLAFGMPTPANADIPACQVTPWNSTIDGVNYSVYRFDQAGTCRWTAPVSSAGVPFFMVGGGESGSTSRPGYGGVVRPQPSDVLQNISFNPGDTFVMTVGGGGIAQALSQSNFQGDLSRIEWEVNGQTYTIATANAGESGTATDRNLFGWGTASYGAPGVCTDNVVGMPNSGNGGSGACDVNGVNQNGGSGQIVLYLPAVAPTPTPNPSASSSSSPSASPDPSPSDTNQPISNGLSTPTMTVVNSGFTSARLSWQWPSGEVFSHSVLQYKDLAEESWHEVSTGDNFNASYSIFDLQPGNTYQVKVALENSDGVRGDFSIPLEFTLHPDSCGLQDAQLEVSLLSVGNSFPNFSTTWWASDPIIFNDLCEDSQNLHVQVFDAITLSDWNSVLDDSNVIVIPPVSEYSPISSYLAPGVVEMIQMWVSSGGRVIVAGARNHATFLEELMSLQTGSLEFEEVETYEGNYNLSDEEVISSLPVELLGDGEWPGFRYTPTLRAYGVFAHYTNSEFADSWSNPPQLAAVASKKSSNGSFYLLADSFQAPNADYGDVLRQAVYGSMKKSIRVETADTTLWIQDGGVSNNDGYFRSDGDQVVRIGSIVSNTTLSCYNTPWAPAIVKVEPAGVTVTCGEQEISDGGYMRGRGHIYAKLVRYFSIPGGWSTTRVVFRNPSPYAYNGAVWFGGDAGLGDSPSRDLSWLAWADFENSPINYDQVEVLTPGANINYNYEPYIFDQEMRYQISSEPTNLAFGGGALNYDQVLSRNQIIDGYDLNIPATGTYSIEWLVGQISYAPGCDRFAMNRVWTGAVALATDVIFNSDGNIIPNSDITIPSFATYDCLPVFDSVNGVRTSSSNGQVQVEWDSVTGSGGYEIEYRLSDDDAAWSTAEYVEPSSQPKVTKIFSNLTVGQTYEFRVRTGNVNRNEFGDFGLGPFSQVSESSTVTVAAVTPPSSEPTAPPTTTPLNPPVEQLQPPTTSSPVVSLPTVQQAPNVPLTMKKGKTLKFSNKTAAGLTMAVSASGACKSSAVYAYVKTKVLIKGKLRTKKVKVQRGWYVKAKKKGQCSIYFASEGNAEFAALRSSVLVTIK